MNQDSKTNRRTGWTLGAVALVALLVGSAAAVGQGGPFGDDDHPGADAPGRERSADARAGHDGHDGDAADDSDDADDGNATQDAHSAEAGPDGNGTITICHVPPGNPDAAHTIVVGAPAWQAHEGHGDSMGACPDDGAGEPEANETDESDGNETDEPEGNETVEHNATADVGVAGNATSDGDANATFTFVVTSEGNDTATNVTLDVDFSDADANLTTLSGDAAASCTLGNGTASCDLGDLAPGGSATLVIELNGTACGDVVATGSVGADEDIDDEDDEASTTASMRACG